MAAAGVHAWVAGGWAVDALAGRQTRDHQDLDLAVDVHSLPALLHLLGNQGFVVTIDEAPARLELAAADGRTVDIHPVVFTADGSGAQAGVDGETFHYAADGFTRGTIAGWRVPCLSVEQQLRFRTGYERRAVDDHDIALLQHLRSLADPQPDTDTESVCK